MLNQDRRTNRLLSLLSDVDYQRLRPHLSHVVLDYKKSLYEASRLIEYVYFPIDGVASLVITTSDGHSAEVGTIGSEGMVGLPVCLGDRDAPSAVYVQVPGTALKMDARIFRSELDHCPALNLVMLRYAHAFFNQVAQSAACAHLHRLEQRCCRWLLMTRDRMPSGDFLLTQEFLGMMLGCPPDIGHRRDGIPAEGRADPLSARPCHDPRSRGAAAAGLRMLRDLETRIRPDARRHRPSTPNR